MKRKIKSFIFHTVIATAAFLVGFYFVSPLAVQANSILQGHGNLQLQTTEADMIYLIEIHDTDFKVLHDQIGKLINEVK